MSIFGKNDPPSFSLSVDLSSAAIQNRAADPAPSVKPAADFHGLEQFDLAVGEVYGLRVWRIDSLGRLRARNVSRAKPWRPGVNQALCVRQDDPAYYYSMGGLVGCGCAICRVQGQSATPSGTSKVCLTVPNEDCHCGFYAYSDPKHEEAAGNGGVEFVLGVVKGTGRTLIGTKGFRCEKAEIVALRDPTRAGKKQALWRTDQLAKLQRVYPDVPLLPSRADLLAFAPIEQQLPDPSTDEFWNLP